MHLLIAFGFRLGVGGYTRRIGGLGDRTLGACSTFVVAARGKNGAVVGKKTTTTTKRNGRVKQSKTTTTGVKKGKNGNVGVKKTTTKTTRKRGH